jgi:hypothetical protein
VVFEELPVPITASVLLVPLLLSGDSPPSAAAPWGPESAAEVTAFVRSALEPAYRNANGFGFRSFACRLLREVRPGDRFDCDAVDEKGTPLRYVYAVEEGGRAYAALVSFPVSKLPEEYLAELEPPCRAFLEAFDRASWEPLARALHPGLGAERSPEILRAQLGPVRRTMGRLRSTSLREAAFRSAGDPAVRNPELVFTLDSENGVLLARFGLVYDGEVLKILSYMVHPEPGGALQAAAARTAFAGLVSTVLGEPVESVAAPFERLVSQGDVVVGTAALASGRQMAVRIVQSGRRDDFEKNDFRIEVLDAAWLIRKSLASRSLEPESVVCPANVVPDGASLVCDAILKSGERYAVTLERDGGEHTISATRAPAP